MTAYIGTTMIVTFYSTPNISTPFSIIIAQKIYYFTMLIGKGRSHVGWWWNTTCAIGRFFDL